MQVSNSLSAYCLTMLVLFSAPVNAAGTDPGFNPELRLRALQIDLQPPGPPVANYATAIRTGNLLYLAGHGPASWLGPPIAGKLGQDVTIASGREAARRTAVSLLATIKGALGDLRKVKRVIRVTGMVNAVPEFTEHPQVIDGCSDLLVAVFGDRGRHTRVAVGMASLPFNVPVEISMIVEIEAD